MTTVPVTQARATLRALVERVRAGEEIVLTQHGEPVAVLVHPSHLRPRRAAAVAAMERAAAFQERLRELRRSPPPWPEHGFTVAQAEELVAAIRADRDAEDAYERIERERTPPR